MASFNLHARIGRRPIGLPNSTVRNRPDLIRPSAPDRFSPYNVCNREQDFGRGPGPRGSGHACGRKVGEQRSHVAFISRGNQCLR